MNLQQFLDKLLRRFDDVTVLFYSKVIVNIAKSIIIFIIIFGIIIIIIIIVIILLLLSPRA